MPLRPQSTCSTGGAGNDTLQGVGGTGTALGGAGTDILRGTGAGSTWTLNGGADNDTIYLGNLYFSQEDGTQIATGGTGADRFYVYTASNGTERDRITDFNAAEGDLIELDSVANGRTAANGWWPIGGASLLFRGAMDPR
jgi:Ca2+-binding RTX toxin-like protein